MVLNETQRKKATNAKDQKCICACACASSMSMCAWMCVAFACGVAMGVANDGSAAFWRRRPAGGVLLLLERRALLRFLDSFVSLSDVLVDHRASHVWSAAVE